MTPFAPIGARIWPCPPYIWRMAGTKCPEATPMPLRPNLTCRLRLEVGRWLGTRMKVASPKLVARLVAMCQNDPCQPQSRPRGRQAQGLDAHRSTCWPADAKRALKNDLWSGSRGGRGHCRTHSVNVSVCSAWMARTSHTISIWYEVEEHVYEREKRSSDPPRTRRLYRGAPRSCSEPL